MWTTGRGTVVEVGFFRLSGRYIHTVHSVLRHRLYIGILENCLRYVHMEMYIQYVVNLGRHRSLLVVSFNKS